MVGNLGEHTATRMGAPCGLLTSSQICQRTSPILSLKNEEAANTDHRDFQACNMAQARTPQSVGIWKMMRERESTQGRKLGWEWGNSKQCWTKAEQLGLNPMDWWFLVLQRKVQLRSISTGQTAPP